ncbi:MAG: S49 family peptidase, partial [bacterium]|nr:S49 family peptidase [bacterium]
MGSKVIADALKKVDKPTISVITEYGTSGAYWIASQTDYIVADELSIVGSIGVLGSYLEFGDFLEDYNVTYQRLVTGKYKDISSPYREMTEEEEELIMERLQGIHDYFVADVAQGRGMEIADVEDLANGLFYLGKDSVENGLVDYIGNKEYAIELTREMAGITEGEVSEYAEEESFFSKVFMKYTAYSSFYIGQGIGSVLFSVENSDIQIEV